MKINSGSEDCTMTANINKALREKFGVDAEKLQEKLEIIRKIAQVEKPKQFNEKEDVDLR